jgi:hypothetical protein
LKAAQDPCAAALTTPAIVGCVAEGSRQYSFVDQQDKPSALQEPCSETPHACPSDDSTTCIESVSVQEPAVAQEPVASVAAPEALAVSLDGKALVAQGLPAFPRLTPKAKDGSEVFYLDGKALPHDVSGFWRWACSDLVGNSLRGLLAEYIVHSAVGSQTSVRVEWDACDIETPDGIRVEVKASGYLQSWDQKRLSGIAFDIAPKRAFQLTTSTYSSEPRRPAHVYVFAIHKHQDKATVDPLDVGEWTFYVAPTRLLDARCGPQKTIGLSSLVRLGLTEVGFLELAQAIARAACPDRPELAQDLTQHDLQSR